MIFDARTPINALPKPLSIFLKISTPPQTICFRSPNVPNWYTHCSNDCKKIDFAWKTPSRFDHFQTQCFYEKNTLQKTSKRFDVFHSKLHFCMQSFQKVLIFDARTFINVPSKTPPDILKISTLPQTICFRSPNAPNWRTQCSISYKIIDFEWRTSNELDHLHEHRFRWKNMSQKQSKRLGVFHSKSRSFRATEQNNFHLLRQMFIFVFDQN